MVRLDWQSLPRNYNQGLSNGVLYFEKAGIPWNGLVSVDERVNTTQVKESYFDGRRLTLSHDEGDFAATIQAYTYPDILDKYERHRYGMSYRTKDSSGDKIHIVYNALIRRPSAMWSTNDKGVNNTLFQWTLETSGIDIPGGRDSAHLVIDCGESHPELIGWIEDWLYGSSDTDARLPSPQEFVDIFEFATTLKVTHNGDGTYTVSGPDHMVSVDAGGGIHISAPTVSLYGTSLFSVRSI